MAREAAVCNECYKNCLLLHRGKQDQTHKVATFFKVIFGKRFSELLFVPPKQSRMLTSLVGQTCYLEDSIGHEWEVVLSYVEGCLAFKEGWHEFSVGHDIEQGDFLVFHFNMESNFIVTVYGRSGWEKTFSSERSYQNKRAKTTTNFTTKKVPSDSFSEGLELQQKYGYLDAYVVPQPDTIPSQVVGNNVDKSLPVARNVPKAGLIVEPSFLTEKETTFAREDDREHLLDLSAFELPDMKDDKFHLFDLSTFMTTEVTTDTREYHAEHQSYPPSFEYPDINSSFAREGDEEYLCGLPTSEKIDNIVDAKTIGELQGSKCSQNSGLHGVQAGDTSTDTNKFQPCQGNTAQPSKIEAILSTSEYSPTVSVSPSLDMPLDSPKPLKTIIKNDNFEPSAAESGYNHPSVPGASHGFQAGDTSVGQGNTVLPSNENEAILSTPEGNPTASVSPALDIPSDSPKPLKTIINDSFELSAAEPVQAVDALIDTTKSQLSQKNTEQPSTLEMPSNSPMPLQDAENSDFPEPLATSSCIQPPGETMRIIRQGQREIKQEHFRNLDLSSNKKLKVIHGNLDANLKTLEDDVCNHEDLGVNLKPMKDDVCNHKNLGVNLKPMEDNVCNREDLGLNLKPMEDGFCDLEDFDANLRSMEDDVLVMHSVKSEPADFCDSEDALTSATASRITCSIPPGNESFLELLEPLPVVKLRQGKKLKQKLILLRDPDGDDWPVVYHEKYGVKVLASGWNAFRKANNIGPGDECAFVLDDSDKGLFRVHILKN